MNSHVTIRGTDLGVINSGPVMFHLCIHISPISAQSDLEANPRYHIISFINTAVPISKSFKGTKIPSLQLN